MKSFPLIVGLALAGAVSTASADSFGADRASPTSRAPAAAIDMDMRAGRILVDTMTYESSRRGIFAAGDIAYYANKQKLILSGFHEAALALRKAYHYAFPQKSLVHVHTSNNAALKEKLTSWSELCQAVNQILEKSDGKA